ncbi:hypothetical protein ACDQ55_18590 [Chitinophaga sp. 30R24]|uniref:hypothetical protein n=1 Tax=Chitinophaga sp. 30R24 TaxID=3248838 RepID=UPI003B8FC2C4
MAQTDTGLIVPIDITALCVGIKDQEDQAGTSRFAGATTTFTRQTGQYDAFLGSNVVRSLADAPLNQLKKGIHLHWALPEALTRGVFDSVQNKTIFPVPPNRWLLSRIVITNGIPARTTWVIESDSLYAADAKPTDAVVTLPVKTITEKEQNYRYTGISALFTADWQEPADPQQFKNLTGQEFSAVASGDTTFAAFYPNCRNIFGFYDELAGIDGPADIMYQLTGWYGTAVNDPLYGGKTNAQLEEQYGWSFQDSDSTPDYSFYSGLTQAIAWNVKTSYIVDSPDLGPIPATATVGNNPAEAFSAYFKDRIHPDLAFFEQLLNAFQTGILPIFREPAAGQLALLQELLHGKQFNPSDAGTIYLITQKTDEKSVNEPDNEVPVTNLPLQLGIALNQLNVYQQQYDYYTNYVAQFKGLLFANWYRLMKADSDEVKNDLDSIIREQIAYYEDVIDPTATRLQNSRDTQQELVKGQVDALNAERRIKPELEIKETPANRYWQPNEPLLLLTAPTFTGAMRFGRTGVDKVSGYLVCRINDQVLQAITVNNIVVNAAQFSGIALPVPNQLPHPDVFTALLQESCLLNTNIISVLSGVAAAQLETSLKTALDGGTQTDYTFTGLLPAAKAVRWWNGNPWNPIMVIWETDYAPLQITREGEQLKDYPANFFTNNYKVDQNQGGFITYTGAADPIQVMAHNKQLYTGSAILTDSAAESFAKQLAEYLEDHTDETLQNILEDLGTGKYLSFSLNGFGNELIMQNQDLQLNIKVPESNPYFFLTDAVVSIVGKSYSLSPSPNGYYNPIRAGYMLPRVVAVDVYGQKREIDITNIIRADSMISYYKDKVLPDTVFLPPRVSQPVRLIFQWLAAVDNGDMPEMNTHPATTPVCGWLLPNHLDESLFFYDQYGKALGNMYLNGDHNQILWQSAPGDNKIINQGVEQVFLYQNPTFAALAKALMASSPAFFQSFWTAIDSMHNFVNPDNFAQNNDLAVLIGSPVAVTQVMLRLEVAGSQALNQSWYSLEPANNNFDNVQFPVVLGDLQKINDGLIGYFKQGNEGIDFSTFYSEAAVDENGVVRPGTTNLKLTLSPKTTTTDPVNMLQDSLKVLALVDPRAALYATTGIVPVMSIEIPPDQYADTINTLEMTFLTSPILRGITGFNIPLPQEEGYQWSWVEMFEVQDNPQWTVNPDISYNSGQAVAAYTPQGIREGWLRLNPQLLSFVLLNLDGQPAAQAGKKNEFSLVVTNKKPAPVTFSPGQLLPEGDPNTGAIFYLHFGKLIDNDKVPDLRISLVGWDFKSMNSTQYGNYWAVTPTAEVSIDPDEAITFTIQQAQVADIAGQVQVYADYTGITGINDGSDACLLSVII